MEQTQYELELAEIERQAESARQELARKRKVLEYMDAKMPGIWSYKHFVCVQSRETWVSFSREKYESLRAKGMKDADTPEFLHEVLRVFPPVPMVKVKDGCTSFKPLIEWEEEEKRRAEKMGEQYQERNTYDCGGVRLHVNTYQDREVEFIWETWGTDDEGERERLGSKGLIRVAVKVSWWKLEVGKLYMRARYYGGHESGKVSSWERCDLWVDPKWSGQVVKWASGGPEYPNSFEVYWDKDTGARLDYGAMFKGATDKTDSGE